MTKKIRTGTVVSNRMIGTVVVAVERQKIHRLYGKAYRVTHKYHADTAGREYKTGMIVKIEETKPISKTKSWKVVESV